MEKKKLLLLFGGESSEHEVSIASAKNVLAALDKTKFEISLVYIDKTGRWWLVDDLESPQHEIEKLQVSPMLGSGQFAVLPAGRAIKPDIIFPVLHGPNGEDGSVQGLFQLLHVPYVGCGVVGSAACMDKEITKQLLGQAGLPVVDYVIHRAGEKTPEFADLSKQLGAPLFVKPANQGSSVGVSKVSDVGQFAKALETALQYDGKVLIERGISGRELECAVLGNENPEVSGVGEVKAGGEFYSYEAKYDADSTSEVVIPAELDQKVADQIRDHAARAFKVLSCRGLARVDFFFGDDGKIYINEINTLPGFTNISMYPKLWQEKGLTYPQLVDKLVELALPPTV